MLPPPTPFPDTKDIEKKICCSCTKCCANIEILGIDEKNNKISFLCVKDKSHNEKGLSIDEFLKLSTKNIFLYSKCSNCDKSQFECENKEMFGFCVNCNLIFCENCVKNHKNTNNSHLFINNNERSVNCLKHPEQKNSGFCFDCQRGICAICIEKREHLRHKKCSLNEVKPSNDEINKLLIQLYPAGILRYF